MAPKGGTEVIRMRVSRLMRFGAVLVMAGCVTAMTATKADAAAMLRLTDVGTATSVTITDNLAGDSNGAFGAITWIGSLGVWTVNVSTGITKPIFVKDPHMDLNSVNTSTGAGTLIIEFTDTDWNGTGSVKMLIGGTTGGTVTYDAYADPGNLPFSGDLIELARPVRTGGILRHHERPRVGDCAVLSDAGGYDHSRGWRKCFQL